MEVRAQSSFPIKDIVLILVFQKQRGNKARRMNLLAKCKYEIYFLTFSRPAWNSYCCLLYRSKKPFNPLLPRHRNIDDLDLIYTQSKTYLDTMDKIEDIFEKY